MNDNIGNIAEKDGFESIWKLYRGGKEIEIEEQDLTDEEVRALRCNELLQEFDPQPLHEEAAQIKQEIERREARLKRMDTFKGASEFVKKMRHKVEAVVAGKLLASEVTDKDARMLETVYTRTLPYAKLSHGQEHALRAEVRKSAQADFDAGCFQTMNDALRHYGLESEVEDA